MKKSFFGRGLPGVDLRGLGGALVAIEGGDSVGCSTQVSLLKDTLERLGYPVATIGIGRSEFMGAELAEALKTNLLCPLTLSLFHATELLDQVEKTLLHSLRAGFIVIADRYVYTVMAKSLARGGEKEWITSVFGGAIVPDVTFALECRPEIQAERSFAKKGTLDYWESGRDLVRKNDLYESFIDFQGRIHRSFKQLSRTFQFELVNTERVPEAAHEEILKRVKKVLPAKMVPDRVRTQRSRR